MSRRPIPAEAFDHGDQRRYNRGCRCRPCTRSATAASRRNRYLRDTGRGSLTTPDRAAAHIARLRASGTPDAAICTTAAVVPDVFYRILRGEGRIRYATERRILAVNVPTGETSSRSGAHVPNLGTVRRLRTLAADGWPSAELGRRAGKQKQFIVYLQNSSTDARVRLWVAGYIRDLYIDLHGLIPEAEGVRSAFAARTRGAAARKGWAPSAYWDLDDFDNPNFEPAAVDTAGRNELAAARRSEVEHLDNFGLPEREIAARLGIAVSTVHAIVRELRTGQRRDRTGLAA
ncbi:hypothetical protein ACWGDX_13465 [Streptomyces sp. NPDC055025]